MSWAAELAQCAAAYAFKLAGVALAGRSAAGEDRLPLELLVVPVLAALIVVQTLDDGRELVLDARAPAVLVAAVLVWRRVPLLAVVVASGATAAGLRALGV